MATLFNLTAQMQSIEDALYENGGELTPELEEALVETRDSIVAKVDAYYAPHRLQQPKKSRTFRGSRR